MKKLAAIAEAHSVMMAPHDGSLGPVAEMAAVHLIATHGKWARWLNGGGSSSRRPR